MSPENIATASTSPSALVYVILICMGIIALWGIISLVRWIVDLKTASLPDDIRDIKKDISEIKIKQAQQEERLEERLWSPQELSDAIKLRVDEHAQTCSRCASDCANFKKRGI